MESEIIALLLYNNFEVKGANGSKLNKDFTYHLYILSF